MQRWKWIDVLKGFGIVFVVLGHVASMPLVTQLVFMFHMPLFFLIGGWLHRPEQPQRDYLRAKSIALLLPYVCYLLILWPLELLAAYPGRQWDEAFILQKLLKPMLLGGPLLKGYCAVFWFVTCYFLTQQVVHHLVRHCSRRTCAWLFSAMLLGAYLQSGWLPHWLPWNAHTVLFAAPLYYLGYRAREWHIERFRLPCVAVALAGVVLNLMGLSNRLDLKYLDYGLPLATLVSAVGCCAVLALLARELEASRAGSALAALGGASMTIMFTHQFIQLGMANQLGWGDPPLRIATALLLGWLLHRLLQQRPLPALLFIGRRAAPPGRTASVASIAAGSP